MKEYKIIHITQEFYNEILDTEHGVQHGKFVDRVFGSKPEHYGRFFFEEDDKWIGCDNRDGNCYVEQFDTLGECLVWLIDYCEEEE